MAMELSTRLGLATTAEGERVRALLTRAGLPLTAAEVSPDAMLEAMTLDKKAKDGRIRFVVCNGIGRVSITAEAPREAALSAMAAFIA